METYGWSQDEVPVWIEYVLIKKKKTTGSEKSKML